MKTDPRRWAVTHWGQQRKGLGVITALCYKVNRQVLALRPRLLVWAEVDKATHLHKLLLELWQTAGQRGTSSALVHIPTLGGQSLSRKGINTIMLLAWWKHTPNSGRSDFTTALVNRACICHFTYSEAYTTAIHSAVPEAGTMCPSHLNEQNISWA